MSGFFHGRIAGAAIDKSTWNSPVAGYLDLGNISSARIGASTVYSAPFNLSVAAAVHVDSLSVGTTQIAASSGLMVLGFNSPFTIMAPALANAVAIDLSIPYTPSTLGNLTVYQVSCLAAPMITTNVTFLIDSQPYVLQPTNLIVEEGGTLLSFNRLIDIN